MEVQVVLTYQCTGSLDLMVTTEISCDLAYKIALKTSDFFVISGNTFCCFCLSFLHNSFQASDFPTDILLIVLAVCVMNNSIFRDTAGW